MVSGITGLFEALARTGIGPFMLARDNPRAYPVMLAVIGLALVVTLIGVLLRGRKASAVIGEIIGLIIALVILWLVWLIIATPATAIPFWRAPTSADSWWLLPAHPAYAFIAVTLRTIALLILSYCLGVTWLMQLVGLDAAGSSSWTGLPAFIFISIWLSPLVLFAETRSLPLIYTGAVDLLGVILLAFTIGYVLRWALSPTNPRPTFDAYKWGRAVDRLSDATIYILIICGALLLAYTRSFSNDWFQLVALYALLTLIDGVISSIWASRKQDKRDPNLLVPRRWLLTIPLTVAIGTLGANGAFAPYLGATHILPSIWATASAAAAAYMLFHPLVSLATNVAGVRARQQDDSVSVAIARMASIVERFGLSASAGGIVARAQQPQPEQPQPEQPSAPAESASLRDYLRQGGRDIGRERELKIYEKLNFRTWRVILVVMILLRLGLLYVHLAGGFNSLLVTFIFGLITLIAGAINLFDNKILLATRPVFLMLMLVIGVVAVTSLGAAIPAISAAPGAQEFFQTVQQLLIMMTIGQLAYLYRVVDATISSEQAETEVFDTEGLIDYTYTLYNAKQYEKAIHFFDEVNLTYPGVADAWHLKGYAHLLLDDGKYEEALAAVNKAIKLTKDQDTPDARSDCGDYLDSLGRIYQKMGETQGRAEFEKARAAYLDSLRYRPNNVDTLTLLAQTLRALGAEDAAQQVDRQIEELTETQGMQQVLAAFQRVADDMRAH